jgi:hypothetical protein
MPALRLTSLLLVEERLLEANHFLDRMEQAEPIFELGFELHAFLSAARSVTFLIQSELSDVPGFRIWWAGVREQMSADAEMRFFLLLRNFSQKAGRVRIASSGLSAVGKHGRNWRSEFLDGTLTVPNSLRNQDLILACRSHLAKLARVTLRCSGEFPYHCCPRRALTPEGVVALGLNLGVIEEAVGLPRGFVEGSGLPRADQLRLLGKQVDGVDYDEIARIAYPGGDGETLT